MYVPVIPVAKPRMTRSDKWKERDIVMRYRAFKDELRLSKIGSLVLTAPMWLVFVLPLPPSWPKKRILSSNGKPHQQKPDIDNLVKGFLDALLEDDSVIYEVHALKVWGSNPGIYYGKEDYDAMSQAFQVPQKGPDAEQPTEDTPGPTIRGVRVGRGLRMRGVLPRTQGR